VSTDAAGDAPPNPRVLALDLLTQVLRRRRPLDEALEAQSAVARPDLARLAARDRGFIRLVVATCLRRLGQIDALIDACLAKPLPAKAAPVRDVLRLGIAQLVFLGTAAHAAVNSTVELAEAAGFAGHKGLVNAMMRRLVREGPARIAAQDAAILNTPDWLWRSWTSAYGEATGRAIAAAHLAEPPLDLTVKSGAEAWAARLGARILPTGTLRLVNAGSVADLAGYGEGGWWVQDAAAALPARLLGDVRGQRVIDLCAAPGGKTAQLAAAGAIVTAVDRTQKRLVRLSANLDRLGLAAELVAADAALWRPPAPADAVLLDAPCSATGTIRRHPDLPWLKTAEDVTKLAAVQDRLLAAAIAMVRPGGSVVFCTCSLEPMEGPERIGALLASDAPVALDPIQAGEIELPEAITQEGFLRTLPCQWGEIGGMDGFFAARVRRAG
jgi:16S rRNA (cytosine967-C5)-methyltransferase